MPRLAQLDLSDVDRYRGNVTSDDYRVRPLRLAIVAINSTNRD